MNKIINPTRNDLKDLYAWKFAREIVKHRDVVNGVMVFKGFKPFTDQELVEIAELGLKYVKESYI